MTTIANVKDSSSAHWYTRDGKPAYDQRKKDGSGMRKTTLADARKLNLLPSVTTILGILDKPALTAWKIEQAVLAVVTSPRKEGEADDAFIQRVLHDEEVQHEERDAARDKGIAIHNAIEALFRSEVIAPAISPWVVPAFETVKKYGFCLDTELVIVGEGYAGMTDVALDSHDCFWLLDFKGTKSIPDPIKGGAWPEHRLQLAAYAAGFAAGKAKPVRTANVYISSVTPGQFVVCEHDPHWQDTFQNGFLPLVKHWQWSKGYVPS